MDVITWAIVVSINPTPPVMIRPAIIHCKLSETAITIHESAAGNRIILIVRLGPSNSTNTPVNKVAGIDVIPPAETEMIF